jgi:hypothetical protein
MTCYWWVDDDYIVSFLVVKDHNSFLWPLAKVLQYWNIIHTTVLTSDDHEIQQIQKYKKQNTNSSHSMNYWVHDPMHVLFSNNISFQFNKDTSVINQNDSRQSIYKHELILSA